MPMEPSLDLHNCDSCDLRAGGLYIHAETGNRLCTECVNAFSAWELDGRPEGYPDMEELLSSIV